MCLMLTGEGEGSGRCKEGTRCSTEPLLYISPTGIRVPEAWGSTTGTPRLPHSELFWVMPACGQKQQRLFFSSPSEINERYKGGRQQGVALHCDLQASAEIKWKTQSWWEEPAARLGGSHQRAEELGFSYRQQPLLKLKYLEGTSGFLAFREQDELLASGNLSPVSHMALKLPDTSRLGQGGLGAASPALPLHLPAWICTDSSGGRPRLLTARSEHYCHNSEKMMMANVLAPSYVCN